MRAESAHQALGEEGADCGRNEEGLDSHVDQSRNTAHRIIRVQG